MPKHLFTAITDTSHIYTLQKLERMNLIFDTRGLHVSEGPKSLCLQYQIEETGLDNACVLFICFAQAKTRELSSFLGSISKEFDLYPSNNYDA